MDASDTTKKRKSKAVYIDQLNKYIAENPGGDCANFSTCISTTTNCIHYFPSYANKYTFFEGKNACTGCDCPLTGNAQESH